MGEGITIYGLHTARPNKASLRIKAVFAERKRKGYYSTLPFSIGSVGADVERYASSRGIKLASRDIYISQKFFAHSQRSQKGTLRVTQKDIADFPTRKRYMHKYFDGEAFIYTDYKVKFIVYSNYRLKLAKGKTRVVNLVTAGKVTDVNEFKNKRYERVEK